MSNNSYLPFQEEELEVIGTFPTAPTDTYYTEFVIDKLNTPITPRENFERFFKRDNPLWVPDIMTDMNYIYPRVIPDNIACAWEGGKDAFGSVWVPDTSAPDLPSFPEPGNYLLKDIADWRELEWPDPSKWDWDLAREEHKMLDQDRMNGTYLWSSLFERMVTLMGFENASVALIEDPDSCHDFIKRLEDYNLDLIEHVHKYLDMDIILFGDDWASKNAPFFSMETAEEFFAPHISACAKRAHELGMVFMHHCCGNSASFVPLMIEEGVDWWEYDYGSVKDVIGETIDTYGDKIFFDGYPGAVDPLPEDDEEFKQTCEQLYHDLAGKKCSTFTITDYQERSFDLRGFCYKLSRDTYK